MLYWHSVRRRRSDGDVPHTHPNKHTPTPLFQLTNENLI